MRLQKLVPAYATASANKDVEGLIEADYLQSLALTDLIALVVSEDNPNISATPAYLTLMDEISSSEAELAYARRVYNLAVEDYNASVRRFPRIIIANMFSFDKERLYWKASDGELEIPEVVLMTRKLKGIFLIIVIVGYLSFLVFQSQGLS